VWNDVRVLNLFTGLCLAVAAALLAYGLLWQVVQSDAFAVRHIDVTGDVSHLTRQQVQAVVYGHLRGTFFQVNLPSARDAFAKLPWVRHVQVRRRWPDRIEFAVEEHRPLARWGSTALVNEYGEVFEGAANGALPRFQGPEGTAQEVVQRYLDLGRTLESIGRRIAEIRLNARRAWQLRLDDGTVIELGRDDIDQRLAMFVEAYERTVAQMEGGLAQVDLRYANGFAVRAKKTKQDGERA
jgi:cell division protein FtsQ